MQKKFQSIKLMQSDIIRPNSVNITHFYKFQYDIHTEILYYIFIYKIIIIYIL